VAGTTIFLAASGRSRLTRKLSPSFNLQYPSSQRCDAHPARCVSDCVTLAPCTALHSQAECSCTERYGRGAAVHKGARKRFAARMRNGEVFYFSRPTCPTPGEPINPHAWELG
jgi:hypothetical protein